MCHHGTLIVAENIHIAFDDLYYLERACMTQLMAMGAAGREAIKVELEGHRTIHNTYNSKFVGFV